ncbi:MAG: hypothetical protein ACXW2I_06890 [Burkholderiales bacterium]
MLGFIDFVKVERRCAVSTVAPRMNRNVAGCAAQQFRKILWAHPLAEPIGARSIGVSGLAVRRKMKA